MARFCPHPARGFILDLRGMGVCCSILFCSRLQPIPGFETESSPLNRQSANTKIKREETFSLHGRLFACLSLSRFPTILEPGTGHESPRKRITLQLRFSKSIVDFGPQRQLYFYNLHSGPAIRTDAGREKAVKTRLQINTKFLEI